MRCVILLTAILGCSSSNVVKKANHYQSDDMFTVEAVDSVNSFYIVYLERQDTLYKIVSEKVAYGCPKIKTGNRYEFDLVSILQKGITVGSVEYTLADDLKADCFAFDENTNICKEPDRGIYDLFQTNDLKGLCYIR